MWNFCSLRTYFSFIWRQDCRTRLEQVCKGWKCQKRLFFSESSAAGNCRWNILQCICQSIPILCNISAAIMQVVICNLTKINFLYIFYLVSIWLIPISTLLPISSWAVLFSKLFVNFLATVIDCKSWFIVFKRHALYTIKPHTWILRIIYFKKCL